MPRSKATPVQPPHEQREQACLELRLKQLRGQALNGKETGILEKWNRDFTRAVLVEGLRSVPKGIYCQMAGRQQKVIDEFAARYDLPIGSDRIDLFLVLNSFHSRVSELAAASRPYQDIDDAELQREKLRQEIVKLQKQSDTLSIDISTKLAELIPKAIVVERLEWLSGRLRAFGSQLHRIAGPTAQEALNEFLATLSKEVSDGVLSF